MANDSDDFHRSWMRRSVLVSGLSSPTQLFSSHSVLSEAPKASRGMEDLMPFEPNRALFEGVEAYQQGYV